MPNSCETPETNFCASVLAKAVKIDDPNIFGLIHEAIGNIFDAEILKRVEQLATSFSELPLHILDRKIEWLKSHGHEPIDVKAIFAEKREPELSLPSPPLALAECATITVSNPKEEAKDCSISVKNEDKSTGKKRAKKSKRKKNQLEQNVSTIALESSRKSKKDTTKGDTELDQDSISALVAEIEKAGELSVVTKRKKKKKKKDNKPPPKNTDEQEQPAEQPTNFQDVDSKSSTEMPMLDSGIGSGVVSGGEDKSSILSGGTVESVGENVEMAQPVCYNFEFDGNSTVIRDYLENHGGDVCRETQSSNHNSETGIALESAKTLELTFGCPIPPSEKVNAVPKGIRQRGNRSKTSIKNGNANILNTNKKIEQFQFSFKAPAIENVVHDEELRGMMKSFPTFKDIEVEGDFDHDGAVHFLNDEWNKTLKNPLLQWCP